MASRSGRVEGPAYEVAVVGGGPAGCAAAIALARAGHRVLLLERRRYPAHRLCGEFLSTEVRGLFERLGVEADVQHAGAHPIRQARLTTGRGAHLEVPLPGTGLGLSRYVLDRLLFERARAAGADARDGVPVTAIEGSLATGFRVSTPAFGATARVVLGAWGKRDRLDGRLGRAFLRRKSPYVAFKAHFEGLSLPGVVELHAFAGGYCGLSHVEGGRVNACWITRAEVLQAAGGSPDAMVARMFAAHPTLADRFGAMRRVTGYCAAAQLAFTPKGPWAGDVCLIGDTAGMIAPLCGDGMAMALQSGLLAARLAAAFLAGDLGPEALRRAYARAWREAFAARMWLGRGLHGGLVRPAAAGLVLPVLRRLPGLAGWLVRRTRG